MGWFETSESKLLGLDLVRDSAEKVNLIRERLKTTQSRQESYANNRHGDLEFQVVDYVFLKVLPFKGIMRFGKKGTLSS